MGELYRHTPLLPGGVGGPPVLRAPGGNSQGGPRRSFPTMMTPLRGWRGEPSRNWEGLGVWGSAPGVVTGTLPPLPRPARGRRCRSSPAPPRRGGGVRGLAQGPPQRSQREARLFTPGLRVLVSAGGEWVRRGRAALAPGPGKVEPSGQGAAGPGLGA